MTAAWRAEAERRDGAGPITLHEDVRSAQQRGKRLAPAAPAQIDGRRQFSPSGVDDERLHRRQVRRGDQQHVGSMCRERAAAHRTGNDARQVEHLDARERAIGRAHGLRRCIADLIDGEERQGALPCGLADLVGS
jgi:hypothetical protein